MAQIKTLENLRDYINSKQDYPLDVSEIIERNGWVDEQSELYYICNDGNNRLQFDSNMKAVIVEYKTNKRKSVYDKVQEIKKIEQSELIKALKLHGDKEDNGFEIHFECENPIIAAYGSESPFDVVILAVRVDEKDNITILGDDKDYRGNEQEINVDDIFAGQLEFITDAIYSYYCD